MSYDNRIGNKAEDLGGKAKEAAGGMTDDDELKARGKADQAKAGLKDAAADAKDAARKAADNARDAVTKD